MRDPVESGEMTGRQFAELMGQMVRDMPKGGADLSDRWMIACALLLAGWRPPADTPEESSDAG